MKSFKKVFALLLVAAMLLTLVACAKQQIIGTWVDTESGLEMTFEKDGTLTMKSSGVGFTGTYEVKGNRLTINILGEDAASTITSISGSKMTLKDDDGSTMTLTKK